MTTIVYRDGILAGDTQVNCYDMTIPGATMSKVRRIGEKWLVGMAGPFDAMELFVAWAVSDFDPAKRPDMTGIVPSNSSFSALVVDAKTGVVVEYETRMIAQHFDAEFRAIGSGATLAYGAMGHGATAVEAVRIASKFDKYTNNNVEYFFVENGSNG